MQAVIGRALFAIFLRQTESERVINETTEHNGVGFTGGDAKGGSLTAKFWKKHGRLEGWMVDKWLKKSPTTHYPRICKYAKQLNDIANESN